MVTPPSVGSPIDTSTRARLVEAAVEVFAERGYEGTRVQDVARRAGLTTGAIYANFRDKNELLAEAIKLGGRELMLTLGALRRSGASSADLLRAMGERLVDNHGLVRRQVLVESMGAARRNADIGDVMRETITDGAGQLVALVEAARGEGDVGEDVDAESVARFAHALALGYYVLETLGMPPPDREAWARLMNRVVAGLADGDGSANGGAATDGAGAVAAAGGNGRRSRRTTAMRSRTRKA